MRPRTILLTLFVLLVPRAAAAFCGYFVGSTTDLYSDATKVVLMRSGDQTVVSMRPDYVGPVENFAIVVPVPQVLAKDDVRTLDARPFDAIDQLTAPRLVEYHEHDPCYAASSWGPSAGVGSATLLGAKGVGLGSSAESPPPVRVKSAFQQAEYDIVILEADESAALEDWLNAHGYAQPPNAAKFLAPYLQQGMYFFAAKVDAKRVRFEGGGRALLSPLQFRYTSDQFSLPIRLGLLNARGHQDLIVFILGDTRYEAANRRNLFIPTNFDVSAVRAQDFAAWYDAMFARQMENRPHTMITEYAWPAWQKCDPCPPGVTVLSQPVIIALGGALLPRISPRNLVITRLHTRYSAQHGTDDIVFQRAEPVRGGREVYVDGDLEQGASPAPTNAFQARYAIRHRWKGATVCANPQYGVWTQRVSVR